MSLDLRYELTLVHEVRSEILYENNWTLHLVKKVPFT